jgi:putative glycosyltransferase (TIGR04348 family)
MQTRDNPPAYNPGMKIFMACPAPPNSRRGNRVTADRWARIIRHLGHRLTIAQGYDLSPCDVMIALHARRSYDAAKRFRQRYPHSPLIVAMTGTDLYRDIHIRRRARRSLEMADRLVVLQPFGIKELPPRFRAKARVIYQSAEPARRLPSTNSHAFDVCVLGHLRQEKDPLRTALAVRLLPAGSKVRVVHAGEALNPSWAERAGAAEAKDSRYRWLGEVPRGQAQALLARSRLLVLSSRMEGGANVISEAIVNGVPVLASRISGSIGLLGKDYPGYFPVGDTRALARLLRRAETESRFYSALKQWCRRLAPRFDPKRESLSWSQLLAELCPSKPNVGTTRGKRTTATGC